MRKSSAILFALLVLTSFLAWSNAVSIRTFTENNLMRRYLTTIKTFWAAESGLALGRISIEDCELNNNCTVNGQVNYGSDSYPYTVDIVNLGNSFYRIDSSASKLGITKELSTVVELTVPDASNFPFALESRSSINISGSAQIIPSDSFAPDSSLDFENLFGASKDLVKTYADFYYLNPENNVTPCQGITWVEVPEGSQFHITSNGWQGSGILIVEGSVKITGGTFNGIIYVIGGELEVPLDIFGNPEINGCVISETDLRLRGNVTVTYSLEQITNALNNLRYLKPETKAWWDTTS